MSHSLLAQLHDTEFWANYRPQIPKGLYLLAFLGIALILSALWGIQNRVFGLIGLGLGGLLLLPVILVGLLVAWKWIYRSKVRSQMLDTIAWRGDEMVLDVGCGSGLLLNGAARRLKRGKATGIDIWVPHSGGGSLDLLWRNAQAEGVAGRIEFKEADARVMPFEDETFDVVLSSGALHHICHSFTDHEQVIHEMVRVLKPGGQIIIWDVTHMVEASASRMSKAGVECQVKEVGQFLGFEMGIVFGKKVG
jgi:SAM-dependent methyltransferase